MDAEQPLWPARSVAEHAYCPRLFYFMAVENVFLPSHDTEQGLGIHRRVDRPSPAPATAAEPEGVPPRESQPDGLQPEGDDRPQCVRSLALSSTALGLTATLDLAELDGRRAIPVEYRKGRPRRPDGPVDEPDRLVEPAPQTPPPEPWPTDRLQVGLQTLLLEEVGYEVPEARIYYAAERRRVHVRVDETLRRDARALLEAARRTAQGPRPLPLINDPRCPRCSLQPICLPDEITHQRLAAAAEPAPSFKPRRMWPPRDEGVHLVAHRDGVRIGVQGSSFRITDRDGQLVRELPLASLESLAVVGNVQVSTQALSVLTEHDVPVAFLSPAGRLTAMTDPMGPTSAAVRAAQVRTLDRPEKALELARAVTVAKIANQRTLLMRNHPDLPPAVPADMAECMEAADRADTLDRLRGCEGNAAAIYFGCFPALFRQAAGELAARFETHGRRRRPPPDPINAVLSFGYAMLANECTAACRLAGLEPALGALHGPRPGRPALSLDLMEPFRPLIADSVAISAFNRHELTAGHFLDTAAGCALTDAGRKAFFAAYGRRMETEVTHPVFGYRLSYRRMLMLHARLIAAWMLGEVPTPAFLTTR